MTPEEFIKGQLCLYAWREVGQYGLDNMEAVLHVIRNRHRAGWGEWLALLSSETSEFPNLRNVEFQRLLQRIDNIFNGTAPDRLSQGALFFGDLTKTSDEFNKKIAQNGEDHPMCATIGVMTYFR